MSELRVAITTVGCKLNQAETSALRAALEDGGHRITGFDDEADAYIVNTCTVTSEADRDSRKLLRRARRRSPEALVIAVGCYSHTDCETLEAMPEMTATTTSTVTRAMPRWRIMRQLPVSE